MENSSSIRLNKFHIVFFLLAILLTTVVRASLILVSPFVILILIGQLRLTWNSSILILMVVLSISYLLSFFNGFYLSYNLVSFYYVLPFLLLLFTRPGEVIGKKNLLDLFFRYIAFFIIINDLVGILQYIEVPNDDSFAGIYGHFTVTQNGLSLINSILFYYYAKRFQYGNRPVDLVLFIFFLLCALMGFYGAGMVILLAALILATFKISVTRIIQGVFISVLVVAVVYYITGVISPATLQYNKNVIKRFRGNTNQSPPRKLLAFSNYVDGYLSEPKDLIFGSGPGTFNSRSAFLVGSPDYFAPAAFIKSEKKPYYFENYAYTLWNPSNIVKYHEGFMNQPFSSLLAFLGEYGLLFTVCFFYLYYRRYKRAGAFQATTMEQRIARDLNKFISIFLVFLLIIDNYVEYPEITIFLLTIMKLSEIESRKEFIKE